MRFYRVEFRTIQESSLGMGWFTTKSEAEKEAREFAGRHPEDETPEVKPIDITPTKEGILNVLRVYASHPDNG